MFAKTKRHPVFQPGEVGLRVIGTSGVDDERPQPVAAFQRPLRDIGVLHAGARNVDGHAPVHTPADLDTERIHPVRGVPVFEDGPAVRVPGQQAARRQPEEGQQIAEPRWQLVCRQRNNHDSDQGANRDDDGEDPAGDPLHLNRSRIQRTILGIRDGN